MTNISSSLLSPVVTGILKGVHLAELLSVLSFLFWGGGV